MVAASGEQYEITGGGYRAVVTECGAGLRRLQYAGRDLVHGYDRTVPAPGGRGQLLLPWPNRIRDGHYTFDGNHQQLALSEPARHNAIHGLTRWVSWSLEKRTEDSVSLAYRLPAQKGYPWTLDLLVRYEVSVDGLSTTVTATNLSASQAPYAQGAHPYLIVGEGGLDGWELMLPAKTRLLNDESMIPVGAAPVAGTPYDFATPRPIDQLHLDDAFTDLTRAADGTVTVELREPASGRGVALWMDRAHGWVQIYTGDDLPFDARVALAVEPMTAPANAFVTGNELERLGAAGSGREIHTASWGIHLL